MWVRLVGLLLIFAGLALSYFGWRSLSKIQEIEDDEAWEDAVNSGAGDLGFWGMVFGAGMILFGGLMALGVLSGSRWAGS